MNKLIRLSPTGIEYGDYAWNFASGCGNNIDGKCKAGDFNCWAYPITQRFSNRYPNGFNPTIHTEALLSPLYLKKPSRILCAFMGDLFWDCPEFDPERVIDVRIPSSGFIDHNTLKGWIFDAINTCPQHTFLFLTKQPQNLIKFSPFPDNCEVGVTATNPLMFYNALDNLRHIEASIKYLSIEPLLEEIKIPDAVCLSIVNQVIIGSQTKPYKPPKIEWVSEIVPACDKAGIPVFLKENLKPLLTKYRNYSVFFQDETRLRQEMPQ